jgi:hypothetical protein
MIKNEIISIHNKIVELQLFNRWGGYSVHKTDASNGIPYGVSLMKDCHGNTYTYDDRVETAGYLSIERFSSSTENRQFVRLPVNYTIHIFNTIAKAGESQRFWSKAILILKELKKYYPDVNIESVITGLPDKVEYAKITIRQQYIVPCDYSFQELDELCEGAGLIDVCEPINPSPIYRNLSTHIAASGDFDMTDAFSGWVPPPYPRDRDTIIVKFDDGLAFFTYKNGTWTFDYFFQGSGNCDSCQRKILIVRYNQFDIPTPFTEIDNTTGQTFTYTLAGPTTVRIIASNSNFFNTHYLAKTQYALDIPGAVNDKLYYGNYGTTNVYLSFKSNQNNTIAVIEFLDEDNLGCAVCGQGSGGGSLWEADTIGTIKPKNNNKVDASYITGVVNGGFFQP